MIVFVNSFQLKAPAAEFEKIFAESAAFLYGQRGLLSHRLVRSKKDPNRYQNIAMWDSEEDLRAATGLPGFQDHGRRLREVATTDPQVFETVLEHHA